MKTLEYLERELARWNVTHRLVHRGRHLSFEIRCGDTRRTIYFSGSPVERRAVLNNISNARKVLRSIGAQKLR